MASTHRLRLVAKWNRKIPAINKNKSFPSSTKKKGEKIEKDFRLIQSEMLII